MKEVHNKSTYTHYKNKYTNSFIDYYIFARNQEQERNEAFQTARIRLQDLVINDLTSRRKHQVLIVAAYCELKDDSEIYRAAIEKFNETN